MRCSPLPRLAAQIIPGVEGQNTIRALSPLLQGMPSTPALLHGTPETLPVDQCMENCGGKIKFNINLDETDLGLPTADHAVKSSISDGKQMRRVVGFVEHVSVGERHRIRIESQHPERVHRNQYAADVCLQQEPDAQDEGHHKRRGTEPRKKQTVSEQNKARHTIRAPPTQVQRVRQMKVDACRQRVWPSLAILPLPLFPLRKRSWMRLHAIYTHCVAFVVLDNRTNQHAQRSGALSTYVDFVLLVTILKTLTEDVVSQFLQFRQVLDVCCVARHGEELQVLFSVHGGGEGPLQGQILVGTYYAQVRGSMAREPGVQVTRRTCASAPTAALVGVKWGAFAAPQLFGRSARLLSDQRVLWPFLLLKRNAPWAVKTLQAENGEGVMVDLSFSSGGRVQASRWWVGGWAGSRCDFREM